MWLHLYITLIKIAIKMVHVYHKFHYFDCLTGQHTWPHNHRLFHGKKSTYSANYLDIFLKVVENTFTSFILRFTHGKKTCVRFVQKYQTNCDCEKYIIPLIKHMNDSFSKGGQQALDFLWQQNKRGSAKICWNMNYLFLF